MRITKANKSAGLAIIVLLKSTLLHMYIVAKYESQTKGRFNRVGEKNHQKNSERKKTGD